MIKVTFSTANLTKDEAFKQAAAKKQMQALMQRLSIDKKYQLLTPEDREMLLAEGYAKALVDNLVFMTQRVKESTGQEVDQQVTGFSYGAFDPSLYACPSIFKHLLTLYEGRCGYCETHLSQNLGTIVHFRPPSTLSTPHGSVRSPYFDLAYEQSNLVYSCDTCSQYSKADHFPVLKERIPLVDLEKEQPLLISPYEQARDYIRFNPISAHAYPYDVLSLFYQQQFSLSPAMVVQLLSQHPGYIIDVFADEIETGSSLGGEPPDGFPSLKEVFTAFPKWVAGQNQHLWRGFWHIKILRLNRVALLTQRYQYLCDLYIRYRYIQAQTSLSEAQISGEVEKLMKGTAFHSMSEDALHYWQYNKQTPPYMDVACWPDAPPLVVEEQLPAWMTSSLVYMVLETELEIKNKRRIVSLSAQDYLYGSARPMKCVFFAIDWQRDRHNTIKVRSKQHVWETSFQELGASRALEIMGLFANNEVWAEGEYAPLIS